MHINVCRVRSVHTEAGREPRHAHTLCHQADRQTDAIEVSISSTSESLSALSVGISLVWQHLATQTDEGSPRLID